MFALVKNISVTNPQTGESSIEEVIKLFSPYNVWEDKNGVQHSPETLLSLSTVERQEAGVYDVAYSNRKDDKFYIITQNSPEFDSQNKIVKITFTSVGKEMEDDGETKGLKTTCISDIKTTANTILAATDWMLVRKIERDVNVPESTVTYRAAVVAESNRLETAINAATDVEELIAAVNSANWPVAE